MNIDKLFEDYWKNKIKGHCHFDNDEEEKMLWEDCFKAGMVAAWKYDVSTEIEEMIKEKK